MQVFSVTVCLLAAVVAHGLARPSLSERVTGCMSALSNCASNIPLIGGGSETDKTDGAGTDGVDVDVTGIDGTGTDGAGIDGTGTDGAGSGGIGVNGTDGTGTDGAGIDGTGIDGTDGAGSGGIGVNGTDGTGTDGAGIDGAGIDGTDGTGTDGAGTVPDIQDLVEVPLCMDDDCTIDGSSGPEEVGGANGESSHETNNPSPTDPEE